MDEMEIKTAPASWQARQAYWCTRCGLLSHAVQEEEPDIYAPSSAIAPLGNHGRADGIWTTNWATESGKITCIEYKPYPRRSSMVDQGRTYLLNIWQLLDTQVSMVMAEPHIKEHGAKARGIAETIAILMHEYYSSSDAVVREAMARYKAVQSDTDHETPGLAETIWDAATRHKPVTSVPTTPPKKATSNKLSPEDVTGIKNGVEMGVFTIEKAASIFKVSVDEVRAAVGH